MKLDRLLIAVGVSAALIAACGDDPPPPAPAPPSKPKAAAAAPAAGADGGVADTSQYTYVYNPVGKRDPFRSPLLDVAANKDNSVAAAEVCPEPLCSFDLEQLALVAVVSGDANPVAMLESPDHVGHIVRRNSKVGRQGGKVTQILRDCVVVTEYFLTPDGKKNPNRVNICVKQEKQNDRPFDLLNNKLQE